MMYNRCFVAPGPCADGGGGAVCPGPSTSTPRVQRQHEPTAPDARPARYCQLHRCPLRTRDEPRFHGRRPKQDGAEHPEVHRRRALARCLRGRNFCVVF